MDGNSKVNVMDPFRIAKVNKAYQKLKEGGNVFKDENKVPVTQRINKADVDPTLEWLEQILPMDLVNNKLGSTGLTPTSGDLDIAIDQNEYDKAEVAEILSHWAEKQGEDPRDWVRKSGISVHFKTPIRGDVNNGFVQTDLMFTDDLEWMKFAMQGAADSGFKGSHRHILMSSIAKHLGLKWSGNVGLSSRESGEVISKDPQHIAEILLGPNGQADDFRSVEAMIARIKDLPEYEEMVADARAAFERDGLTLPGKVSEAAYQDELSRMLDLAGIGQNSPQAYDLNGNPISEQDSLEQRSIAANEKAKIMKERSIEPGTQEWFRLWFARPDLTGDKGYD